MRQPGLILCAHGTADPAGQAVIAELAAATAAALPHASVQLAYVDVQQPTVAEAVAGSIRSGPVVVVPALLSTGYHVQVDIAAAVAAHSRAVATDPLGPDPTLAELLLVRLAETGCAPEDPVVLAFAGSSRPEAAGSAEAMRAMLAAARPGPVISGFGAAASPTVPDAVVAARSAGHGRSVSVAAYLLAPGHFHRRLHAAGADRVSAPLGAAPQLVDIVVRRHREGVERLAG